MRGMRYQPQGGARLATSNPLTRGLIGVFVGSQAVDPITGKPFVNSAPSNRIAGVMGIGLNARAGQAKLAAAGPSLANGSMFALFSSTDSNTEQIVMEVGPDGTFSGGVRGLRIYQGRLSTYVRNFTEVAGSGTYDISKPTALGATYAGTAASLYVNGKLEGSGTTSSTTSPASIFNVGGITGDTTYSLRGSVGVAFAWSRTLSEAEMASLASNPWQMFAAPHEDDDVAALTLTPIAAALVLAGYAPTVAQSTAIAPAAAALALTGSTPTITQPVTLGPAGVALTLLGNTPTVAQVMPQTIAPAGAVLTLAGGAAGVMQGAPAPAPAGGGGGSVREVRRFADLLDRARKPTRSQKRKRREQLEADALELLPDLPEAEKLAPIAARIVFEQEARALAPLYAQRPIQALAPVVAPFDAHAALRDLVARLMAEAQLREQLDADDESDIELLLLGS